MNYPELIAETDAELKGLENKQKLVQFQKRIRFLWLLKTGESKTQETAGAVVGWKLRQSQKMWQLYRTGGAAKLLQRNANWQTGKLSPAEQEQFKSELAATGGAASLAKVREQLKTTVLQWIPMEQFVSSKWRQQQNESIPGCIQRCMKCICTGCHHDGITDSLCIHCQTSMELVDCKPVVTY